jgi:hypothetical protein
VENDPQLGRPLIRPQIDDHAFSDPETIREIIAQSGPYPWLQRDFPDDYMKSDGVNVRVPFFRGVWNPEDATDDQRTLLFNEKFIAGSKLCFSEFEVVEPEAVIINLMAPIKREERAHFDLPYYRGLARNQAPVWFLMAMGRSELFERWHINVSSALAWLYRGPGGGLVYWPDGPDRQPQAIRPPIDNRVLISDNQRMYHMVQSFGVPEGDPFPARGRDVMLSAADGGWAMVEDGQVLRRYDRDEIRISILWKALMFRDRTAAETYHRHTDDLSIAQATQMLRDAARRRGFDAAPSDDPFGGPELMHALEKAFPEPALSQRAA